MIFDIQSQLPVAPIQKHRRTERAREAFASSMIMSIQYDIGFSKEGLYDQYIILRIYIGAERKPDT
jgi:hypothetical protein